MSTSFSSRTSINTPGNGTRYGKSNYWPCPSGDVCEESDVRHEG